MKRSSTWLSITLVGIASLITPAFAHITLDEREAPVGGTYKAVLIVGHGCGDQATTRVRVQIPEGFYNVKPMPKSGWTLETVTGSYETPFSNHGTELTEGVKEISWSGGELPNTFFDEFAFRGTFGSDLVAGTDFYFPVIQECGSAEDAWIDTSGDEDVDHPAPSVTLVAPPGSDHAH